MTEQTQNPTSAALHAADDGHQQSGLLMLVTGPSGSGKDTLLDGLRGKLSDDKRVLFAQRIITRPADAGGEVHIAISEEEFQARKAAGDFWVDWQAHELHYALPMHLRTTLEQGVSVIANVSRTITETLATRWADTVIIEIAAPAALISQRLRQRARESDAQIQQRLKRSVPSAAEHLRTIKVANDGSVLEGVTCFYLTVVTLLDGSSHA